MSRLGINASDNIPKGSLTVLLSPAVPSSDKWLMNSRLFSPPSLSATHSCPRLLECNTRTRSIFHPLKIRYFGVSVPAGVTVTLVLGRLFLTACLRRLLWLQHKLCGSSCCPATASLFPYLWSLPRCSLNISSALLNTASVLCCPVVERIQAVQKIELLSRELVSHGLETFFSF